MTWKGLFSLHVLLKEQQMEIVLGCERPEAAQLDGNCLFI